MGLESGTFIDDLVTTNPPGSDDKRQGDDHLRLIKTVLKNTFKRASKAFYLPGKHDIGSNLTVTAADENVTMNCDTSTGSFTLTLPTLTTADAGWKFFVVKTTADANPVFIQPASGTIGLYSKIRRAGEYSTTTIMWTGSTWVASRPFGMYPGTVLPWFGSGLPNGFLWCDGSSYSAADFSELSVAISGSFGTATPDLRGRVGIGRDDMGGSAAGRITAAVSGITGTTIGSAGGAQSHTLTSSEIAGHQHSFTTGSESVTHTHSGTTGTESANHTHDTSINANTGNQSATHTHQYDKYGTTGATAGGGGVASSTITSTATSTESANHTHNLSGTFGSGIESVVHTHDFTTGTESANHVHVGTTDSAGGGGAHRNVQPGLVCNYIILAE